MNPDTPTQIQTFASLGWVDLLGLGLVGLLGVLGIVRGLWWQVIRLLGLVAAVGVARALSPRWVGAAERRFPEVDERIVHGMVWLLVFLAALGIASFLGRLGRKLLEAMQLDWVDRAGGGLAGMVTGIVVHLAVLVGLVHLGPAPWVSEHVAGTFSEGLLDAFGRRWPVVLARDAADKLQPLLKWEDPPQAPPAEALPEGADLPTEPDSAPSELDEPASPTVR